MLAIGLTAILTLALTLFAMQTAFDFTAMGGVLLVLTLVLTIAGVILIGLSVGIKKLMQEVK